MRPKANYLFLAEYCSIFLLEQLCTDSIFGDVGVFILLCTEDNEYPFTPGGNQNKPKNLFYNLERVYECLIEN